MSIGRGTERRDRGIRASHPGWIGAATLVLPGLLVGVGAGLGLGCRPTLLRAADQSASSEASSATPGETRPAEPLYRRRCAACHESDGTGSRQRGTLPALPDFSNHRWQAERSDAGLQVSILEGKGAHMPAFRGKISDQEARGLVSRIRMFDPKPVTRPTTGTSGRTSADPPDDFEERFRRLEEEMQELKRKYRELSAPPKKP